MRPVATVVRSHTVSRVIDLHRHVLPGLDDGALDLNGSLAMAHQAEEDGIAAVCATQASPHARIPATSRVESMPMGRPLRASLTSR